MKSQPQNLEIRNNPENIHPMFFQTEDKTDCL